MKKFLIILGALAVFAVTMSHTSASKESHDHECPQEYVTVRCPVCYGYKIVTVGIDAWGNPVHALCGNCNGTGVVYQKVQQNQPTFEGRQPYYAECGHSKCKCKQFVPKSKGDITCTCGHSKFSHVKRYISY